MCKLFSQFLAVFSSARLLLWWQNNPLKDKERHFNMNGGKKHRFFWKVTKFNPLVLIIEIV
jgi:hypothetical protein